MPSLRAQKPQVLQIARAPRSAFGGDQVRERNKVDGHAVHHAGYAPAPRILKNTPADSGQNIHANGWNADLINRLLHGKSIFSDPVMAKRSAKTRQRREDAAGCPGQMSRSLVTRGSA